MRFACVKVTSSRDLLIKHLNYNSQKDTDILGMKVLIMIK